MRRRSFIAGTIAAAALPRAAAAQSVARSARIGWVTNQSESSLATYVAAFRAALAELGYVEGRNLTLEFGYGDNDLERFSIRLHDIRRGRSSWRIPEARSA